MGALGIGLGIPFIHAPSEIDDAIISETGEYLETEINEIIIQED